MSLQNSAVSGSLTRIDAPADAAQQRRDPLEGDIIVRADDLGQRLFLSDRLSLDQPFGHKGKVEIAPLEQAVTLLDRGADEVHRPQRQRGAEHHEQTRRCTGGWVQQSLHRLDDPIQVTAAVVRETSSRNRAPPCPGRS